jgi:hypothetical protein
MHDLLGGDYAFQMHYVKQNYQNYTPKANSGNTQQMESGG